MFTSEQEAPASPLFQRINTPAILVYVHLKILPRWTNANDLAVYLFFHEQLKLMKIEVPFSFLLVVFRQTRLRDFTKQ